VLDEHHGFSVDTGRQRGAAPVVDPRGGAGVGLLPLLRSIVAVLVAPPPHVIAGKRVEPHNHPRRVVLALVVVPRGGDGVRLIIERIGLADELAVLVSHPHTATWRQRVPRRRLRPVEPRNL